MCGRHYVDLVCTRIDWEEMKKTRKKVPTEIADEVIYRSDRLCAVCEAPGRQIHHIDGNASNNDFDNLILLCHEHHDEATAKRKLSRRLSKGVLLRYRQQLYRKVELKRKVPRIPSYSDKMDSLDERTMFQTSLDANACIEIEKLRYLLRGWDWRSVKRRIYDLNSFPTDIGVRARTAILYVLDDISSRTRHRMPLSVAQAIQNIASNILPPRDLSSREGPPITEAEKEMLNIGVTIGFNLAYDGIRYLENIKVVEQGVEILWQVLRFAHINGISEVERNALDEFDRAIQIAEEAGDKYSRMLLQLFRDQGLSEDSRFPIYPKELIEQFG